METLPVEYSQLFGRSRDQELKPGEETEEIQGKEIEGGQGECHKS